MQQKGQEKRRFGDRRDGKRVRNLDGMHVIMAHLFPNRCDSEVYQLEKIDVTELMLLLQEKNAQSPDYKITPFHYFVTAIAKGVYHRQMLNRFVAGRHTFERNEIIISFVAKRKFADHAEEALLNVKIKDDTTRESITRRIVGDTSKVKSGSNNNIGDAVDTLAKLPRFALRMFMGFVRWLDYHGWVPNALTDGDSNYSSVLVSNLGSIKCGAAYHHLNNYGTNSIMITIGEIHKESVMAPDGTMSVRDTVDLGCTVDERIADGFYFAKSIKFIKHLLAHPNLLEEEMKETVDYEF